MNYFNVLFLTFCFGLLGFSQRESSKERLENNLTSQKWLSNVILGSDDFTSTLQKNEIKLSNLDTNPFGYFVVFKEDGTFESYNQGFCGNECRTHVYGTYQISNDEKITIFVNTIEYLKTCSDQPKKAVNSTFGVYQIEEKDAQIFLRKVN